MKAGVKMKLPDGIVIRLTAENETAIKIFLRAKYHPETEVKIIKTGEILKLEDIFNT